MKKRRKHGYSGTKLHTAWKNMKGRCKQPSRPDYHRYGGRGIYVYPDWDEDYLTFHEYVEEHLGPAPSPKHTIGRIDNNGHYVPGNIRWETRKQQSQNTTQTRHVTVRGVTKSLSEWAEFSGIPKTTLAARHGNNIFTREELVAMGMARERAWVEENLILQLELPPVPWDRFFASSSHGRDAGTVYVGWDPTHYIPNNLKRNGFIPWGTGGYKGPIYTARMLFEYPEYVDLCWAVAVVQELSLDRRSCALMNGKELCGAELEGALRQELRRCCDTDWPWTYNAHAIENTSDMHRLSMPDTLWGLKDYIRTLVYAAYGRGGFFVAEML